MSEEGEEFFRDLRKEKKGEKKRLSQKDRSKFKKTDLEKRKKHLKAQEEHKRSKKLLTKGRVLAIMPEGISVDSGEEKVVCFLGGALKKEISRSKNLLTVGDFVFFDPESYLIIGIEERASILSREDHLRRRQEQLLAANIDQVLITLSVVKPPLKPLLIDRYLIATEKGNMSPVLVINKIDLLKSHPDERAVFEQCLETYRSLGVPCVPVSAETGEGIDELKKQMKGKASVFSGQSGVGKSSLINAVAGLDLSTGELAKKTFKGSHITTSAQLLELPFGGWVIDTPGIRSLGVWQLTRQDLEHAFPEIASLRHQCKFPDCTHSHEPNCAILTALNSGLLSPLRYDSYQKLLGEIKEEG